MTATWHWEATFPLVRLNGAGARDFLQGQSTADLRQTTAGDLVQSCWLTATGRLRALLELRLDDQGADVLVLAGDAEALATGLDQVIFPADRVRLGERRCQRRVQELAADSQAVWLDAEAPLPAELAGSKPLDQAALERQRLQQGFPPGSAELNGDTNPFELGLADRISAGVGAGGLADTTCCALFTATIKLTDEGFERSDEVISLFFQYVEMMRRTGPQEWSWREAQGLRGIEFRFKEEEGAADYTEALAMTMRRYAHEDCLRGDYLFHEYAPEDISEVLSHITPRACVYVLSDHGFDADAPGVERERWFNVPFTRETVDPAKLAAWESAEPDAALSYPPRNEYIAERFDIKGGSAARGCAQAAAGEGLHVES